MKHRLLATLLVFLGAVVGGSTGWVASVVSHALPAPNRYSFLARHVAPPYHVPPIQGGVSLRLAMVHDVLLERYPKHGTSWYEARNREILEKLSMSLSEKGAKLDGISPQRWPLIDDLAVGLDRLGRPGEGIPMLREKISQQRMASVDENDLYTSYANLGTLLIHDNVKKARDRDALAIDRFDEGIAYIHKSIEANPNAHFGREKWQAAIAEFVRATCDAPELLTKFDCIGNRLDLELNHILDRESNWTVTRYGRPNFVGFTQVPDKTMLENPGFFKKDAKHDDPKRWLEYSPIRSYVTKVGAESGWKEIDVPTHRHPVAFDEPILGIIGMWRQGGGANPHFSLALGETMLRVGQRYIAWNAFERASLLADRYSSDPQLQQFLRTHCANRQTAIEDSLRYIAPDGATSRNVPWQYISLPVDSSVVDNLRRTFEQEFAEGVAWQDARDAFESSQLAQGVSTADEHFFNDLPNPLKDIASPVGSEESILIVPNEEINIYVKKQNQAAATLGCGMGAFIVSTFIRWRWRKR